LSTASGHDPAARMAAMGAELPNGMLGDDPPAPSTGQRGTTPEPGVLRENEPDVENGAPGGDDPHPLGRPAAAHQYGTGGRGRTELGDRS